MALKKETPSASATEGVDQNNIVYGQPSDGATPSQSLNMSFAQNYLNIPEELRIRPQWVAADADKIPINPRTGQRADVTDPGTWGTFEQAMARGPHIGFVFTAGDPYCGIDLDAKHGDEGEAVQHQNVIDHFNSYTERSSSGKGYHIIVRARLNQGRRHDNVEIYPSGRHFIFTGNVVRPLPIADAQTQVDTLVSQLPTAQASAPLEDVESSRSDAEIHEIALNANNGEKYAALCACTSCTGEGTHKVHGTYTAMGYGSQSEADMALLSIIAFYTRDNDQVRRIFRCTGLGKRDKATKDNRYLNTALRKLRAGEPLQADFDAMKEDVAHMFGQTDVHSSRAVAPSPPQLVQSTPKVPGTSKALLRTSPGGHYVKLTNAASITPKAIRWLWRYWLARGKMQVLAGSPGTGKTTIAMYLAACITSGRPLPSGECPAVGDVLIWSGEDDPSDTLVPRLIAAGAELSRVHFVSGIYRDGEVQRSFDPARDVEVLAAAAAKLENVALLIIDPLVSAVSGDSHKNAEVRRGLQPLVELADKLDAALIGITHYSKGTQGSDPLERVTGSIAFGAMARIVYGTVRMKAEDGETSRMVLARAKSNIGPDGGGFAYTFKQCEIEGGISTSYIEWGEELAGTARDLLAEPEHEGNQQDDRHTETGDAGAWLRDLLKDGPKLVKDIKQQASKADYAWRTVERAASNTGVIRHRDGFGTPVTWLLPGAEWLQHNLANSDPSSPFSPVSPAKNPGADVGANGVDGMPATIAPPLNLGDYGENGEIVDVGENAAQPEGGSHG